MLDVRGDVFAASRFCAVKKECVLLSMSDQKKMLFI